MTDHVLEVSNLVKEFPIKGAKRDAVHAVSGVSFHIDRGETLGLVGESGSGKTTVGRCILRLIEPTSGSILFHGRDVSHISQEEFTRLRPKMQMIFQDPYDSLNPRQTAADAIGEPLVLWAKQFDQGARRRQVEGLAKTVRMTYSQLEQYPHQMSGGEQQRVGIAKSIATDPDLLVLDEPTSSLDPSAHAEIVDLLVELQRTRGFSYLFISHDLMTIRHISHRVAIMYLSQIIEVGTTKQVFEEPQHPYSRSLLSAVLYPDPSITRPKTFRLSGEIPSPIHLPPGCYLASRCPMVIPECKATEQHLVDLGAGHQVACSRATRLDALGPYAYADSLRLGT
jgi:oligopeptide/dipeptide ABC transporter ATP-binding protein